MDIDDEIKIEKKAMVKAVNTTYNYLSGYWNINKKIVDEEKDKIIEDIMNHLGFKEKVNKK